MSQNLVGDVRAEAGDRGVLELQPPNILFLVSRDEGWTENEWSIWDYDKGMFEDEYPVERLEVDAGPERRHVVAYGSPYSSFESVEINLDHPRPVLGALHALGEQLRARKREHEDLPA